MLQRLRVGERAGVLHVAAVDDVAHGDFGDPARLGARDIPRPHAFPETGIRAIIQRFARLPLMDDPVISKFRAALGRAYGPRLERAVFFGSRARGDARPGSDYDIAVFLSGMESRWDEAGVLAEIEVDLLDEMGAVVHALPYPAGAWRDRASPLMHEIRKDGRDL